MIIHNSNSPSQLGADAADFGANLLKLTIGKKGFANMILATGASQLETIKHLLTYDINWNVVNLFHLDEYIGISAQHPASFKKYIKDRFVDLTNGLKNVYYIEPNQNFPEKTCVEIGHIIQQHPIDVCFAGIGENAHLAFNDPPANFDIDDPYIVVGLDDICRMQQLSEGWFSSLNEVPKKAISMSIKQILKSRHIILSVPDQRKAKAVHESIHGEISNAVPASILRNHVDVNIFLDKSSSSLLN